MIKPFYIQVTSAEAGIALAQHFEKHEGLSFLTEEPFESTIEELFSVLEEGNATVRPVRRYGEIIPRSL